MLIWFQLNPLSPLNDRMHMPMLFAGTSTAMLDTYHAAAIQTVCCHNGNMGWCQTKYVSVWTTLSISWEAHLVQLTNAVCSNNRQQGTQPHLQPDMQQEEELLQLGRLII